MPQIQPSKRAASPGAAAASALKKRRAAAAPAEEEGVFSVEGWERATAPVTHPWPKEDLQFSYWRFLGDSQYGLQGQVLERRGWKFGGDPCNRDNVFQIGAMATGDAPRPNRMLYLDPGATENKVIQVFPESHANCGGSYRLDCFPGTEAACYKRNTAVHMEKQKVDFYPKTYILPRDREAFLKVLDAPEKTLWISKPHNGFSGKGVVAFSSKQAELRDVVMDTSKKANGTVIQSYLDRPLLAGGYKCHLRIYILVSRLHPEPMAYVMNDGHVMFATKPFTLDESSLGKSFDEKVHLTNFDINVRLDNAERVLADKPVVGPTAGWGMRRFEQLYTKETGRSREDLWTQILQVSKAVVIGLTTHAPTKAACYTVTDGRHFQLFGLDMMCDADGKVWLLEANDSPGLASCDPYLEGREDPAADKEKKEKVKRDSSSKKTGKKDEPKQKEEAQSEKKDEPPALPPPTKDGLAIRKAMAEDERITLAVIDNMYSLLGMDATVCSDGSPQNWFRLFNSPPPQFTINPPMP